MTPPTPFWAHGTVIEISSHDIGGITSASFSGEDRGAVETTHSASGGTRDYLPGLREGGSLNLEMRADPNDVGQQALRANYEQDSEDALEEFTITLPGSVGTITFDGFVTQPPSFDLPMASDDAAGTTATIKVNRIIAVS